jgi:hypothetical protein
MKLLKLVFGLLIGQFFMECNRNDRFDKRIEVQLSNIHDEADEVLPPPPGLTSNFKTLQEWLLNACDMEKPKMQIAIYSFGLFESSNNYTIFMVGLNKYQKGRDSVIRIDYEPSNMYFQLPKNEFYDLNREQVLEKLKRELKDFTNTEKFKNSFFAQADLIKADFERDKIWSKD